MRDGHSSRGLLPHSNTAQGIVTHSVESAALPSGLHPRLPYVTVSLLLYPPLQVTVWTSCLWARTCCPSSTL